MQSRVIAAEFKGVPVSDIDDYFFNKRLGSGCTVKIHAQYNRETKKIEPAPDNYCVLDYFDGEYMNFIADKIPDDCPDEWF